MNKEINADTVDEQSRVRAFIRKDVCLIIKILEMSTNKLKQGDFVVLKNSEIRRYIDLLRVNGFPVQEDEDVWVGNSNSIRYGWEGYFEPSDFRFKGNELPKHDWVCAVIGLEEGVGMKEFDSSFDQRRHITEELIKLGVNHNVYGDGIFKNSFMLFDGGWYPCNYNDNCVNLPYSEWCKKLGIDEIYADNARIGSYASENDLSDIKGALSGDLNLIGNSNLITLPDGTTVDLTKPIEVSDNNADWKELLTHDEVEKPHFIGVTKTGQYCFDLGTSFPAVYICKSVRNTPEPEFIKGQAIWFIPTFENKEKLPEWVNQSWLFGHYNSPNCIAINGYFMEVSKIKPAINPDGSPNFPPFND
jgi:hypothetical protein